nr:maco-A 69 [Mamestra configurata nucleopolyhedrovirus A]
MCTVRSILRSCDSKTMFAYLVIRRACLFVDSAQRRVLFNFVDDHKKEDVQLLLERLLLAFDVSLVYRVIENIKAIVWALVKTVYAHNPNVLSLNRHKPHLQYASQLIAKVDQTQQLHEFARDLYKQYCVYELTEDSLSWSELINVLCNLDNICSNNNK